MNPLEALSVELQIEARTTRRMLERLPSGSLAWKPHERSRTLRELAGHIADLPGLFIVPLLREGFDREDYVATHGSTAEILATLDRNVASAAEVLATLSEDELQAPWRYRRGGRVVFELPRFVVLRTTALNHFVHHRGQLSVYLRLLEVPLPPVYGPTADES